MLNFGTVPMTDVDLGSSYSSDEYHPDEIPITTPSCSHTVSPPHLKRAQKDIMTPRLSAALDKCKVSDRDAVHILTACAESLSLNPREYKINRSSIRNARIKF